VPPSMPHTWCLLVLMVTNHVTEGQTDKVLINRGTPPSGYNIMARGDINIIFFRKFRGGENFFPPTQMGKTPVQPLGFKP
jgi:hypothetical protein